MGNGICKLDGCERTGFNRGWCAAHWNRVRRNGDPGSAFVQERRVGCVVDGCSGEHFGRGYCRPHLRYLKLYGDPLQRGGERARFGPENKMWIGDAGRYDAVHRRLREYRGRAADHLCVECGNAAAEWAYQHNGETKHDDRLGRPYCTDLDTYAPMCRPCHRRFDHAMGEDALVAEWLAAT